MFEQSTQSLKAGRCHTRPLPVVGRAQTADDPVGFSAARRLARELESIEASLLVAEKAAMACCPSRLGFSSVENGDVSSRRAELERRESELQERERAIERYRMVVEHTQEKLVHGKDSLKRAILKFRAQVHQQTEEMDVRSRRLDAQHVELLEMRREFARDQIRVKAATRDAVQDPTSNG